MEEPVPQGLTTQCQDARSIVAGCNSTSSGNSANTRAAILNHQALPNADSIAENEVATPQTEFREEHARQGVELGVGRHKVQSRNTKFQLSPVLPLPYLRSGIPYHWISEHE